MEFFLCIPPPLFGLLAPLYKICLLLCACLFDTFNIFDLCLFKKKEREKTDNLLDIWDLAL